LDVTECWFSNGLVRVEDIREQSFVLSGRTYRKVERCLLQMLSRLQTSEQTRLSITSLLCFTDRNRNVIGNHIGLEDVPFKEGRSS
jgi:hypothetical protein